MGEKVRLRPYNNLADEQVVLDLWLRTWKFAYPRINFDKRLKWFRWYWKVKLVPNARITIADEAGVIVGFFTIDATGYLDQIVVALERWGRGVSEMLLAEAKRLSPSRLELRVNADNIRALSFYRKHGFAHIRNEINSEGALINVMCWQP